MHTDPPKILNMFNSRTYRRKAPLLLRLGIHTWTINATDPWRLIFQTLNAYTQSKTRMWEWALSIF